MTLPNKNCRLLKSLQVLDLSLNSLSALPALDSRGLKTLNLERNNVSRIATCALCNTSLQDLNLVTIFKEIRNYYSKQVFYGIFLQAYNRVAKLNVNMVPQVKKQE